MLLVCLNALSLVPSSSSLLPIRLALLPPSIALDSKTLTLECLRRPSKQENTEKPSI
jgi:hypothetical protein